MTGRLWKASLIAAIAAVATLPAAAGEHSETIDVLRGVEAKGTGASFVGNGTWKTTVSIVEGVTVDGPIRVLPLPNGQGATQEAPVTVGCISITTPLGSDTGCKITGWYLNTDPAMNGSAVNIFWESKKFKGEQIHLNVLLTGEGTIAPAVEGSTPAVNNPKFTADNRVLLARQATIAGGFISSEGLGTGLGNLKASSARMLAGIAFSSDASWDCLASLGGACL